MKYKVGDKVKVVKINYEDDIKTKDLIGRVYEISTICKNDRGYGLYGSTCVWQENELELATKEPTLFDSIKSAIIEAGKQAPIIIEQTEDGGVKISPIEEKEQDLPIDTPVMCSNNTKYWILAKYAGNETVSYDINEEVIGEARKYIIEFSKFNPNDIEESLKHNIVK